ncbi:Uncharacterised protein [Mycobacteroides abscessus subsp. abscessus]|nr:Uncharacterised protein [Mycobacteroides abscessus subsp. abscessus]
MNRSGPTRWASMSVPTLDDFPKTPVVVKGTVPCGHASRTVTPPMLMEPGTCSTSSGLDKSFSITADAVMTLLTDPGSNGEETERFPISRLPCLPRFCDGSKVLSLAIARTSPVLESRTTADTLRASDKSLACWTCCCT